MKLKGILLTSALTAMLGVGVFAGVSGNKNSAPVEKAEAAATTTKETDATGINYNDVQGWCFRSLHMYNVTYADGYTNTDFESYLTGFYGAKITTWANQGTTRGWGLNNGTAQDYMICDGGEQKTHSFVFPWWVSRFVFQIVNNGNWLCNWEVKSDWGIHTRFDLKVDGTSVSHNEGSMSAFTYNFPAVTISKVAVNGTTKAIMGDVSIPSETTSIYDKYPNGSSSPVEPTAIVHDFLFDGWYTNQTLTTAFSKKIYTSDATIYAKYKECTTKEIYVDAFNWNNLYVYAFESINNKVVEYYGAFPGKRLTIEDTGLKFNGGMLQKIPVPYTVVTNARFIYSDGTNSNKSTDQTLTEAAYYWHNGSSWTSDSTHYASAAAFVWDLNAARLNVPAGGDVKAYSICGLDASTWVGRYNGLHATAKGYVKTASIYTYKDKDSSGADTTVTFQAIMNELSERAGTALNGSFANLPAESTPASATVMATVIVSIIAISTAAGFLFLKKKKNF